MNRQAVLLEIPDELYEQIRRVAADTQRPLENVLLEGLSLMFGSLPEAQTLTPRALETLPDEQLWALAERSVMMVHDHRLQELTDRSKNGHLTPDEQQELEALVDRLDEEVLLRSQVLLLLKQRGHDVELRLQMDL